MSERFLPDTVSSGFERVACVSVDGLLDDGAGIVVLDVPTSSPVVCSAGRPIAAVLLDALPLAGLVMERMVARLFCAIVIWSRLPAAMVALVMSSNFCWPTLILILNCSLPALVGAAIRLLDVTTASITPDFAAVFSRLPLGDLSGSCWLINESVFAFIVEDVIS